MSKIFSFSILHPQIAILLITGFIYQPGRCQTINLRQVVRLPQVIKESSGLAVTAPNSQWSNNDAGNANNLYCFDTTGNLLRILTITNVDNIDWEDLAVDDEKNVYIEDAGNNDNDRQDLAIHRITNPDFIAGNLTQAESIHFVFEDQSAFPPPPAGLNYDIEALIWKDDSLLLFTRNRSNPQNGYCKQYILPAQPGNHTARLVDSVYLGSTDGQVMVTSAAIHPETGEVLLLTATRLLSFTQYPGNNIFAGTTRAYPFSSPHSQVEAVDFISPDKVYITEEGTLNLSGFLYEAILPSHTGTGELQNFRPEIRLTAKGSLLFIETAGGHNEFDEIQLFDLQGNLLLHETNTSSLSLAGISPGCYIIRCGQEDKSFNVKWLYTN